jgi:hypothetical protein
MKVLLRCFDGVQNEEYWESDNRCSQTDPGPLQNSITNLISIAKSDLKCGATFSSEAKRTVLIDFSDVGYSDSWFVDMFNICILTC